jgi:hypothetical protein
MMNTMESKKWAIFLSWSIGGGGGGSGGGALTTSL